MPTADPLNPFGRIITRRDVELAVVAALQQRVPMYIAQLERQAGLAPRTVPQPPDPQLSFRGGLDFNTWEQAWSPVFIANVQPTGAPERQYNEGVYMQAFRAEVAANFVMTNEARSLGAIVEDSARQYADILGMAGCVALLQQGGLGTWPDGTAVSIMTVLAQYPETIFPYPDNRRIARSTFEVVLHVDGVLTEAGRALPLTQPADPYQAIPDVPLVQAIAIDLVGASPDGTATSDPPWPNTMSPSGGGTILVN